MNNKNLFAVALKAIGFALRTDRKLFLVLVLLNVFQGAVVYVQFISFSSIVDEIVRIKQGTTDMQQLIQSSIILGLSFVVPTIVSNVVSYYRNKFRMEQDIHLDLFRIDKQ
ncbi:MAG TPA: hypothetical protein VGK59_17165, partial [Ohtaekwangia sp.]